MQVLLGKSSGRQMDKSNEQLPGARAGRPRDSRRVAGATLVALTLTLLWSGCAGTSSSRNSNPPTVTSISVAPTTPSIVVGATKQFSATANYSDGSNKDVTSSATWTSTNSNVASVQSTGQATPGLAKGVAAGSATITAAFSGFNASTTLSVTLTPVVTSISISPTNASVSVGSTVQFTVTATYSDGSNKNVTTSCAWMSSDATVATVAVSGLATGLAPGNVNVTASFSGFNAVTVLNVTGSGTLTSFFIAQVDPNIAPSSTLQMFGYAEYSDGSSQWVTSSTHWTSSKTSVATVEDQGAASPGLVTAVGSSGTTTITATFSGLQASTTVTIAANAKPLDLMDMTASENYLHFQGGLYENSSDTVPTDHDTAGKAAAVAIQPLDHTGKASSSGAIVFLGIGMSNATEEFSAFSSTAAADSGVNHATLAIEDGATGAATACYWTVAQGQTGATCPNAKGVLLNNQYDRVRDTVLATAVGAPSAPPGCGSTSNPCLTEAQVQVLWIKNANPRPGPAGERTLCDATVSGCVNNSGTEAILYEAQLGATIRAAKSRYPNLKEVFLATRIYAGYATDGLNPEPYAYEYGYSAKWLIEAQIVQERNNTVDPVAGDMSYTSGTAAWTAWGTYIWADGATPRSDGLEWLQSDFQSDGTHPNATGTTKVVDQLMGYFKGSPYTTWFLP
ncbi:MAG TPA: Ig-like domain-containing protein [Candidatus Dormibacteraeota bacterium]|nr:Ig-like domain-containing protein [Candidatus Dormibacteraeota bacterium]